MESGPFFRVFYEKYAQVTSKCQFMKTTFLQSYVINHNQKFRRCRSVYLRSGGRLQGSSK